MKVLEKHHQQAKLKNNKILNNKITYKKKDLGKSI